MKASKRRQELRGAAASALLICAWLLLFMFAIAAAAVFSESFYENSVKVPE